MRKIYLSFLMLFAVSVAMSQTVTIGTSTTTPVSGNYRSPWAPVYGYSYVQTVYLQSEINVSGSISSLKYKYNGPTLDNSNQLTIYMGTSARTEFTSKTDWEPFSNLTEVYQGTIAVSDLSDWITINLTTPYNYQNNGNLVIAIHENKPGDDDVAGSSDAFMGTDFGSPRVIYYVDDNIDPDPTAPPEASNIKNFVGNIQMSFGTPTPVSLVDFKGEKMGNANKLDWTTVTEQHNKGFELQRSVDGVSFTALDFIKSQAPNGTSNATHTYTFTDNKCFVGNNYYRLKQTDLDGKGTISKVVLVKGKATQLNVTVVYPNPTKNELNLILSAVKSEKATIVITDMSGKIVYNRAFDLVAGDNKATINASGFAKGNYAITLKSLIDKKVTTTKFVKQ